jgi:hypothetical protein
MLDKLIETQNLTDWERNFVDSLSKGWDKYNSITENQYQTLQKVASRYDSENIARWEDWRSKWSDERREKMKVMARYYLANPPYFSDLAKIALDDDKYIPTEKAYNAMCENKYSQKVMNIHNSDPMFPAGSLVMARTSRQTPYNIRGKTVVVIEHPPEVHNAANGAKRVKVLAVGETAAVETEERWLKKLPKKLR